MRVSSIGPSPSIFSRTSPTDQGTAIPTSNLDLLLILRQNTPKDHVRALKEVFRYCNRLSAITLDVVICEETEPFIPNVSGIGKFAPLLYGTDFSNRIANEPFPDFFRRILHEVIGILRRIYPSGTVLRFPLTATDLTNPWN
jgi:hypothetical protein